jgi:hypothetical protein
MLRASYAGGSPENDDFMIDNIFIEYCIVSRAHR